MHRSLILAWCGMWLVGCGGDDGRASPSGGSDGATGSGGETSTRGMGGAGSGGETSSGGSEATGGAAGESSSATGSGGTSTGGTSTGDTSTGGASTGGSGGTADQRCDEGDTVTLDDTTYDEAPSSDDDLVCDPQIMAVYYDDLVSTGPGYNLLLHYDWDAGDRVFGNFLTVNVYGVDAGEYPIGSESGEADLLWSLAGDICLAESGSITLESVGDIGGVVEGSVEIGAFGSGLGDCPDSVEGTFRMTIVDSSSLTD